MFCLHIPLVMALEFVSFSTHNGSLVFPTLHPSECFGVFCLFVCFLNLAPIWILWLVPLRELLKFLSRGLQQKISIPDHGPTRTLSENVMLTTQRTLEPIQDPYFPRVS